MSEECCRNEWGLTCIFPQRDNRGTMTPADTSKDGSDAVDQNAAKETKEHTADQAAASSQASKSTTEIANDAYKESLPPWRQDDKNVKPDSRNTERHVW